MVYKVKPDDQLPPCLHRDLVQLITRWYRADKNLTYKQIEERLQRYDIYLPFLKAAKEAREKVFNTQKTKQNEKNNDY